MTLKDIFVYVGNTFVNALFKAIKHLIEVFSRS